MKFSSCPACGLPAPLCSCSYPDAVYNAVDITRTELITNREISPAEGLSDYDRSKAFTEAYLYGREMNLYCNIGNRR